MRVRVVERTCDGARRTIATFPSRGQAIAYLRRAAEECRATGHRRVELDEDMGVLVTEYGGDDTVVTFITDEEGVAA